MFAEYRYRISLPNLLAYFALAQPNEKTDEEQKGKGSKEPLLARKKG
jgi:hypothetical protein